MKLALYHFAGCTFCAAVQRVIDGSGLEVELRDIFEDPERRRELMDATGRMTVPCLRIEAAEGDVEWMHESQNIARYLSSMAPG